MKENNIVSLGNVQVRNKIKEINDSIDNHLKKIEYYENAKWWNPKHWPIFIRGRQSLITKEIIETNILAGIRKAGSNLLEEYGRQDKSL